MDKLKEKALLDFFDDLTDVQLSRLVYLCLNCSAKEIADRRNVTIHSVYHSIKYVKNKKKHQEIISALQEALSIGGFLLD